MKNLNHFKLHHFQSRTIRAGSDDVSGDLNTKIHEITAEVTVNKAKMADKAMNAITQYISS